MKLLINKNQYGISARISDTDLKGVKATYFLQIGMSLENEKKLKEGKAYLINVKECFPKAYPKKDGTAGFRLLVTKFDIEKVYEDKPASTPTTMKPIEDEILPF